MEPFTTKCDDKGDIGRFRGWERVRGMHRTFNRVLSEGGAISDNSLEVDQWADNGAVGGFDTWQVGYAAGSSCDKHETLTVRWESWTAWERR